MPYAIILNDNELACILVGLRTFVSSDGPEGERIRETLARKIEKRLRKQNPERVVYLRKAGSI